MSRWLVLVLLLAFSTSCIPGAPQATPPVPELTDSTLAQLAKVFALVTDIQKEYEALLTQAAYPDDESKNRAKQWIKGKQLFYEILRVRHAECLDKRTSRSLLEFVELATGFVDVPEPTFTDWDIKAGSRKLVNLSRTESLRDDFYVMAVALVKDVK